MKRPVEVFEDAASFLAAQRGTRQPRKAAQAARPELPRAGKAPRTGLSTYIARGWFLSCDAQERRRLTHPDGRDTGWCESELAACVAAKALTKAGA